MLACIIGVILVVGMDAVQTYHVALTSFLGAGLVFTTSSVNSLIYYPDAAKEAAAAGFILLSIDSVRSLLMSMCVTVANVLPTDRMDVLLRLSAPSKSPTDPGFLRAAQGKCAKS